MDNSLTKKRISRARRVLRVRKGVRGSATKPRLSVAKSNCHLYVQLIDDEQGRTLAGVGTLSKDNKATPYNKKSKDAARHLGEQIAAKAKEKNVSEVVFDRGRFKYHGIIAEVADGARKAGLRF